MGKIIQVVLFFVAVLIGCFYYYTPTSESLCSNNENDKVFTIIDKFFGKEPRQIGYTEWGTPNGFPIIHFHPQPTSRLFFHPKFNETLVEYGLRLFILERPGIGISSPWDGFTQSRTTKDWAKDVLQFVESMEFESVSLIGHSAGCPHAIAAAEVLKDKVKSLILMGPIIFKSSLSNEDITLMKEYEFDPLDGMLPSSQNLYSLGASGYHWVNNALLHIFAPLLTSNIELSYADIKELESEKILFNDPTWESIFFKSAAECYRQGIRGMAQDLEACALPFQFSLSKLNADTTIFVGSDDKFTPPSHAKLIHHLLPNSKLNIIPGYGHWSLFANYFETILNQIK